MQLIDAAGLTETGEFTVRGRRFRTEPGPVTAESYVLYEQGGRLLLSYIRSVQGGTGSLLGGGVVHLSKVTPVVRARPAAA